MNNPNDNQSEKPNIKSDFLKTLFDRGLVEDCSNLAELDNLLSSQKPITAYIGFDCTASSLHVGHLLSIMVLRWFQRCGHRPIVLMGGGTSLIGDPSGKDKTRTMLTNERISQNMISMRRVFDKFLDFKGENAAIMLNNADWLTKLNYIEFLRDYGKHFSVNRMITFDSVKTRLEREQSLSFIEFNYMITQAYDFLELSRSQQCRLQMGGSDQWGNIINGIELARRTDRKELFALTTPLLTSSSGKKMGKTADGAVWLSDDLLSPYDYWQYWRNCSDADVIKFLKIFTQLDLEEINSISLSSGSEINQAKVLLASEATKLLHGAEAATSAEQTAMQTFANKGTGGDLPIVEISENGVGILTACVQAGFAQSNSQARRILSDGGIRINGELISDPKFVISSDEFSDNESIKLSYGKKKHAVLTRR